MLGVKGYGVILHCVVGASFEAEAYAIARNFIVNIVNIVGIH